MSIVSLFVMSGFLGLIAMTPAAVAAPGDLTISGPFTIANTVYYVDGNVKIESTGTLTLQNAELRMLSDIGDKHWFNVSGGKLIMDNSNITTYIDTAHPWPLLNMVVESPGVTVGTVTMTNDSKLAFPGHLYINNSASKVTMKSGSNITCLASTSGFDSGIGLTIDDVDDGPAISIADGTLEMFDSFIFDSPEGTNQADILLTGKANLTAVNSFIDVDFLNETTSASLHNQINLIQDSNAYLYGCTFDGALSPPGDSAIYCNSYPANSVAQTKNGNDTTGQTLNTIYNENDALVYAAGAGTYLSIGNFNLTPIQAYDILSVTLVLKYSVDASYNGNRYINYSTGSSQKSTGILPQASFNGRKEVDLYSKGVDTRSEIGSSFNIFFKNSGTLGSVNFDAVYLKVVVGPRAYIYRWGEMTVTDQYGIPLSSANVSAKFNSSTWLGNTPVYYYTPKGIWANPWNTVLTYLGKTNSTYMLTDTAGKALIPYLTDVIDKTTQPNSLAVGSTMITATWSAQSASVDARFDPYPAMGADDKTLSASVSIGTATALTWDSSKYLVVPTNKKLTGAFTHFGDIIVKPTGNLTLQNVNFAVNKEETAKATVYGTGALWIINSNFTSAQSLELVVKSGGKLVISNSLIGGQVSITVHGSATLQISGSTIQGAFTIDSDATLTTEIKDTSFSVVPTFEGSSTVSLVNVSAASINQEDNSKVGIYRYIVVTTLDLTSETLAGVVINASYQVDCTPPIPVRGTGTTNATGVLALKRIACWMNATGGVVTTTYLGNYRINATYELPPDSYYAPDESVSLNPTDLSGKGDNQEITMVIPVSFADLTFTTGGIGSTGVSTDPYPPINGVSTTISAEITNQGSKNVSTVFDVVFYYDVADVGHLIGTDSMNSLNMSETKDAVVTWSNPPLALHYIIVKINPTHTVIERDYTNNDANLSVTVVTKADLVISSMYFTYNAVNYPTGGSIPSNRDVTLNVVVYNQGETDVIPGVLGTSIYGVSVMLYNDTIGVVNKTDCRNISVGIAAGGSYTATFGMTLPQITEPFVNLTYVALINPATGSPQGGYFAPAAETDYTNNAKEFNLTIIDSRPDPKITASNIALYLGAEELSTLNNNISYAADLRVVATIVNDGLDGIDDVSVSLDINGTGTLISETDVGGDVQYVNLNGTEQSGSTVTVTIEWTYKILVSWPGAYKINITLDKEGFILNDKNTSNNNAYRLINVTYIKPTITFYANFPPTNVTSGTMITISGEVRFPVTNYPMGGVTVYVRIQNRTGASIGTPAMVSANTTSGGIFSVQISIPAATPNGQYNIVATVFQDSATKQITVSAPASIMDYLFIIIIIVIVAVALVFTYFIYRQGVGKLVECGECGSLIPESAKKCPKCGVEFEEDMVKCSECGAWIASDSIECPNCHVRFGTPLEGEKSYEEQMMDQYEHMVLSKYRETAKGELGKNYSEDAFQSWWAANPAYIAFEDWLVKEEERRKQANLITCSVCGTPNPASAENCINCGSPIEKGKGGAGGGAGGASTVVIEKRVIRQPVDRKVVPKKVIKKPLDEQGGQQ